MCLIPNQQGLPIAEVRDKLTHFHQNYSTEECQQATHIYYIIFYTALNELHFK